MKTTQIGVVGGGAMAEAMIGGMLRAELIDSGNIHVADHKLARCDELQRTYGVRAGTDVSAFIADMDVVILAIKPQVAHLAIEEIRGKIKENAIVVSVVAGLSTERLESHFATQPVIRVMPNTPVAVGAGMSVISLGRNAAEEHGKTVEKVFNAIGKAVVLPESLMDAVTGLSGSGPGYVFVMIDAMADAGVKMGLQRKTAITLAAQTMLGAAKMVLDTGRHPAELRDMVTSPGGTTIAAIHVLEEKAVRAALIDAVEASCNKSKAMGTDRNGRS